MSQKPPSSPAPGRPPEGLSRRTFLKGAGGIAAAGGALAEAAAQETAEPGPARMTGRATVRLSINGREEEVVVEPRTTLLDALRNHCDPPLTGTKLVCDKGNCGACTVLLDGRPVYSCLQLAADVEGREVRTVEGLGSPGAPSVVQEAFWEHDASMCGFCTPGFVVSMTACLEENPKADADEIRRACAGNLCRCGTYPHVFAAGLAAGERLAARNAGGGR